MASRLLRFLEYSLCAGLLAGAAHAADPEWLGLIPASDTVVGLNVERLRASDLGQTIFSKFEEWANYSDAATSQAGIQMLRGTREIILAGQSVGKNRRFLLVLSGSFKLADLQTITRNHGMSSAVVGNFTVFSGRAAPSVALADGSRIVVGDPETVRDTVAGRGLAEHLDPALAARVRTLRFSHDFWLLATTSLSDLAREASAIPMGGPFSADLLKSVREIRGGVTFRPKMLVAFEVLTRGEEDATALAKALRTVRIGSTGPYLNLEQIAALSTSLELRAEGDTVKIRLTIPEEELLKAFRTAAEPRRTPPNTDVVIQTPPADSGAAPSSGETGVVALPGP